MTFLLHLAQEAGARFQISGCKSNLKIHMNKITGPRMMMSVKGYDWHLIKISRVWTRSRQTYPQAPGLLEL